MTVTEITYIQLSIRELDNGRYNTNNVNQQISNLKMINQIIIQLQNIEINQRNNPTNRNINLKLSKLIGLQYTHACTPSPLSQELHTNSVKVTMITRSNPEVPDSTQVNSKTNPNRGKTAKHMQPQT